MARQELGNEISEGFGIRIGAVEHLFTVLTRDAPEAGARSIDKDEIGRIQQGIVVIDELIRRGRVWLSSAVTTRFGPNAPICSHSVAEPGPPL